MVLKDPGRFLTPVLKECESCGDREEMLHFYQAGTSGPDASQILMVS
jgi:hypothetical protein